MLEYTVELESGEKISGTMSEKKGEMHIRAILPEGIIKSVNALIKMPAAADEKIFMNGYQTWTHCPERGRDGKIRGLSQLPRPVIDYFGLERYGDYLFQTYPNKRGITHGVSYCYFRRGLNFRLVASLDERPGYTMFLYDAKKEMLSIRRDCAGIKCGGEYPLFDLFFAEGGEDEVFDAWFEAMKLKPRTKEKLAGYSSWYNRYQNIDENSIKNDLAGCARVLSEGDLFQVDDGWEPFVGDWLAPDAKKFPGGMKAVADAAHAKGYKAGLWLAPFVAEKKSGLMREHKDWFLSPDGKPWYCGCNWSGFYALDIDNPEVVNYIERCFRRVFDDWGFDLVKLDFLYAAAPYGTENETRAGRMIRAMELLRRVCGDKLILGCGVPVMPAFGLVDYCRVSCDVGLNWGGAWYMRLANREIVSTKNAVENSLFRRQLNGRAYMSDPDVFFLRDENLRLTADRKYQLASVCALFGGITLCSDDMGRYDDEKWAQYREIMDMRRAENLRVDADDGLSITYDLDGVEKVVVIE